MGAKSRQGSKACTGHYIVRMIKPNFLSSHDWHVQPDCQRSTPVYRLSGPFWIESAAAVSGLSAVLELVALCFGANFLRLSNLAIACQALFSSGLTG